MSTVLKLENIRKAYDSTAEHLDVLCGVNLSIEEGERVAILGHSGSGKSTLLHIAGLLDLPTSGQVSVNGVDVTHEKDKALSELRGKYLGFVYQEHHLMKNFTALENVLMPAKCVEQMTEKDAVARANYLLETVGLADRASHLPSELSGGEKQRVAIARALMNKPKLLLADEPTGNLDPETAAEVFALFNKLAQEENMAMLMVTHNHSLGAECDKVYDMQDGVLTEK